MTVSIRRRTTCRLCDSGNVELVLKLKPTPLADAYVPADRLPEAQPLYPLDLFLCSNCGHVQLLDVVDATTLFREYLYETSSSPGLVEHFREYADAVVQAVKPRKDSLVVEMGSNDGTLLGFFRQHGLRVLGVDAAQNVASRATARGIPTVPEFFTESLAREIRREHGPAAIVAANNVFAHADDLADVASGVRELLDRDGLFVFEVSYALDLIKNMVFDFIYHEHLCYHSVSPMRSFLARHGMELVDAVRVPLKGGSLRIMARPLSLAAPVSPRVQGLLDDEMTLGLRRPEMYADFDRRIDRAKVATRAAISGLQADGRRIAGFGASATTTTLLYHFELGDAIEFIVDDNVDRQNLFSPGLHIPVLAPDALYEKQAGGVVLLAWRFVPSIIKNHQRLLDRGARFVVPLPEVRTIS